MLILLHVRLLLSNVLVNKFQRRQILGKQSVSKSRNNRRSCVFHVVGEVTTVDSDRVRFSVDSTDVSIVWLHSY
jgi:hypothetical protein